MARPRREFVDSRFGQIHARIARSDTAARRPVLLFHMFPQSSRSLADLAQSLSSERTAIAPDFPGYGESDPLLSPITAEQYAEAMWDVIDGLDWLLPDQPVDLFGIHGGAKVAVEFAAQRPNDVNHIVLSSAALLEDDQIHRIRKAFTPIPLDQRGRRFEALWQMLIRNAAPDFPLDQLGEQFADMVRAGERYTWGNLALLDYNAKFRAKLESLPHDVDLINPCDDLFQATKNSKHLFTSGRYIEREDWKHGFTQQNAEDLGSLLLQLFARDRVELAAE